MKRALITGVSGQDGAYLAHFLLERGYEVYGTVRRRLQAPFARLDFLGIAESVHLIEMDLARPATIVEALEKSNPDEIYNLAGASFVGSSWQDSLNVAETNAFGVHRLLEAMRVGAPSARLFQASSAEMFGAAVDCPQNEMTPFQPKSPYAVAKVFAHQMVTTYRTGHGLFACSGILFNHESPLRGPQFVTRKISQGIAAVATEGAPPVKLGNVRSRRDWGFAGDYVDGMWRMLQAELPTDYVLATGRSSSVRDFVDVAARSAGFSPKWSGSGLEERCFDTVSGKMLVEVSSEFYRQHEPSTLRGDWSLAQQKLGWSPNCSLEDLAQMMIAHDLRAAGPA